ncbi:MAG: trans-sulfuration enzyme family protein [Vulcanimicrobiaceae bacterium]
MKFRHPDTAAVHAGTAWTPSNAGSSPALFQASSYVFADLDEVESIYAGDRPGAIYGRYGGPNARQFESAMVELEGAEASVAAAAGMAAIDAALATNVRSGEAIVATKEIYGGTFALLEKDYQERGVRVVYVDQQDLAGVREALQRERPRLLYLEALTNPLMHVADLPRLLALAREAGALSVVDATFATPVLVRPCSFGADLILHSVGKYIGGHGDVGAGVLSGSAALVEPARAYLVRTGATIPHFEAWLALRGLRTLALRMARHSSNATAVAEYLATRPEVERVYHPSRPEHRQHALAAELYPAGTGGIVAFDLAGGRPSVDRFLRGLRTVAIVHSLGEVATTISFPAVSSHRPLPAATRRALGVGDGTLRLSTGIEDPADIIADLAAAFAGLQEHVRA